MKLLKYDQILQKYVFLPQLKSISFAPLVDTHFTLNIHACCVLVMCNGWMMILQWMCEIAYWHIRYCDFIMSNVLNDFFFKVIM